MTRVLKKYIVKKLRDPPEQTSKKDVEWVAHSLGFVTRRDQDKTAFRILNALIQAAGEGKGMTSEELSEVVEPTVGSVIYHLKKLMNSGLIVKFDSTYELRGMNLKNTIEEIKKEINMTLESIMDIAGEIDEEIGLKTR